jgi:hypothetical protein
VKQVAQIGLLPEPTLPYNQHAPTSFAKRLLVPMTSFNVTCELLLPETAMYEDRDTILWQNRIWRSWQILAVQAEAQSLRMQVRAT